MGDNILKELQNDMERAKQTALLLIENLRLDIEKYGIIRLEIN